MSQIEWTEKTWNPIVGCSIVSPGCTNCYAMKQAARIEKMNPDLAHYRGLTQPSKAGPVWTGKIALSERALLEPLRRRTPTTWFVNSMGDLFHEDAPDEWIDRVFRVINMTPHHTYQILTKRARRMRQYMADQERVIQVAFEGRAEWPPRNAWLGVSAEDQKRADERIPDLLATPAAVRFVSAEPLLGQINFEQIELRRFGELPNEQSRRLGDYVRPLTGCFKDSVTLDWIIVGGESGPNARPMQIPWARSILGQCRAAGVACFVKQLGTEPIWEDGAFLNLRHGKGADMSEWPSDLRVQEFPNAR